MSTTRYGSFEAAEDPLFEGEQLGVDRLRGLRGREHEHLDLRELMHPIEPLALPSVRARFGPVAMGDPGIAQREVGLAQDLAEVEPAEGDFGGADEAEVGIRE